MTRDNLENKPLAEAIFELNWKVPSPGTGRLEGDPHYRILMARFSERVQGKYPFYEQLPAAQVPDGMIAHSPQHRFRAAKNAWPLLQLGHGVMTVNDTEGYHWEDFRSRLISAVQELHASHPSRSDFELRDLTLRYINAIQVDFASVDVFEFLRTKLKSDIALPEGLFSNGNVKNTPTHLVWETAFPTENPAGSVFLKFATGQSNGKPALIMETRIHTPSDALPDMPNGYPDWLNSAHDLAEDWFFQLIKGDLEKKFS